MSKSSGSSSKRKLPDESWLSVSEEVLNGDLDAHFASLIEQVQTGNHVELRRRNVALERLKEKHIAACDRHRREQIKNINQLYEYEIEDAKAQYQRAYSDLQEQLVSDIMDECTKLKHIQKKMQAESQKTEKINSRSLRSSYGDTAAETNSSKSKNKRKLKDNMLQLNEVIPESLRRADLLEIVRDLHEQAQILDKNGIRRSIGVLEDNSGFAIDQDLFHIGDNMKIFSHSCSEQYVGVLTMVSPKEFIVRTGNGSRISFHLAHIESGRLQLSHW